MMDGAQAALGGSVERFSRIIEQLVRSLRTVASVGGISPSMASALGHLESEGPLRITELARAEGVSQPAMTQLVGRMESDGLVERETPDDDRRSVLITTTARGRDILSLRRARRSAYLHELLETLGPADRGAIENALPALERLVSAAAQQPSTPPRGTATR
jgi:DNA-binding MarR family transcriptional regulator